MRHKSGGRELSDNKTIPAVALILAVFAAVLLVLPLVRSVMMGFTGETDLGIIGNLYTVLRGVFAVVMLICVAAFLVMRRYTPLIPGSIAALVLVITLTAYKFENYWSVKSFSDEFDSGIDMTLHYVTLGECLLFLMIALFLLLYSTGAVNSGFSVILFSVLSVVSSIFTMFDYSYTFSMPMYDILCFGCGIPCALCAMFCVFSVKPRAELKYKAKRMKR